MEKGGGGGGCDPILQNGARHNLFIWCPSDSPFLPHAAPLTFLPLWHPLPFVCLPSVLLSLVTTLPLFLKTVLSVRGNAAPIPARYYRHYSHYPHQVI